MSRALLLALLLTAALALALRVPKLGLRPMHNDEAVNAVKFGELWERGTYKYDPNEHHGPSLPYATLAFGSLTRSPDLDHFTDARLRALTVIFGLGLILLLPLVADGLGRRATLWAGLFTGLSPAMVFYSRYYIHEMLLVFFTFLALAAGWRYWRARKIGWALLAGAALGLMQATKETFIMALFAAAVAGGLNQLWNRFLDASPPPARTPRLNWGHVAASAAAWLVVWLVLFSSFFTNLNGLLDPLRTYLPWLRRAGGASPHIHPWSYYFHHLLFFHVANGPVWTEGLLFALALVGAAAGFIRKKLGRSHASLVRFLTFYSFGLAAIYSGIAYKTPWCLLSFWHGMILLAGVGASVLLRSIARPIPRLALTVLLLTGAGQLGWQAWQVSIHFATATGNPYTYAQTSPDVLNLVKRVESLAEASPDDRNMVIKVMSPESVWPLPWYLREFKQVGWWDELPPDPFAPVMIVSANLHAALDEKKTHLMIHYYELRPNVFLELYVELDLWKAYLPKHPPKRDAE